MELVSSKPEGVRAASGECHGLKGEMREWEWEDDVPVNPWIQPSLQLGHHFCSFLS